MKDFKKIISREHWVTQQGEKKFPHEFESEHLANTIRYLHRQVRPYRLEEARQSCLVVHHTGNRNAEIEAYYRTYRKIMDDFLGDLDDKQWLKENSKIYCLLIEEADYREIDYSDKSTKTKYTGSVSGKYSLKNTWNYLFSS
jgi:hypothetical protein